ncbi:MAG: NAD-dependent deacylase [Planctomycetota bacterium]|nr:MAG: NAD-dependent deacylase [Planctomycetota bacterium]
MDSTIQRVAQWLSQAQRAVVFTGAGISTESGIPDFRSPGGVWARNQPVYFDDFMRSPEARFEYWRQKAEMSGDFLEAQPNSGHEAIARWEQTGRVEAVITQNIDGLHQAAGSRRVLELHGTARWVDCLDCAQRYEPEPMIDAFRAKQAVPSCPACGGRLKSATISFGQALPAEVLEESGALAASCDLFFAIGSSLVVYPAAGLPELARRSGAKLVIINRDPTDFDATADAVIHASIGTTLAAIDAALATSES